MLDFVTDNLKFDDQVVKSKAKHTLPYSPRLVRETFANSNDLGDQVYIEPNKYKPPSARQRLRAWKKASKVDENTSTHHTVQHQHENNDLTAIVNNVHESVCKFIPLNYFRSASDGELNTTRTTETDQMIGQNGRVTLAKVKSLEDWSGDVVKGENKVDEEDEWDWDCHLVNQLSENTARWIVMKKIERDG